MKNQDLAEIETPEAETWHVYAVFDAEQEYINDKLRCCRCLLCFFQKLRAAQITAVCRHNQAHSYHYRKNFYSEK